MVATWINAGKKCVIHDQGSLLVGVIHQRWDVHGTNLKTKRASYGTTGHLIFKLFIPSAMPFPGTFESWQKFTWKEGKTARAPPSCRLPQSHPGFVHWFSAPSPLPFAGSLEGLTLSN